MIPKRRLLAMAGAVGALSTLAACTPAPPATAPSMAPRPQRVELRVDGFDRHARQTTYRIRNIGCSSVRTGSGFVLDPHHLVTNRHVVEGARRLQLSTWDGRGYAVEVSEVATTSDLAVVKTRDAMKHSVQAGRVAELGSAIFIAGYPGGGAWTLSRGRILRAVESEESGLSHRLYLTSAKVSPGSSGGPVFDEERRVVGVVVAQDADSGDSLIISIDDLNRVLLAGEFSDAALDTECP